MRTKSFPRFMICAPSSGSGKTLITCAVLRILDRHGYLPASYKCGPDYIDPMFHSKVLGIPSRNLDVFLMGKEGVRKAISKGSQGRNIGVLEGVMGFFDGIRADTSEGSSQDICSISGTPALLVVSCKGMSRSVIPMVKGFCDYDKEKLIKGIILNNISPVVAESIKNELEAVTGVPVVGMLPRLSEGLLESRHLGLVMPSEIPELLDTIDKVADKLEENLELEKLLEISKKASEIEDIGADQEFVEETSSVIEKTRIGVALDEAFCFYYRDNLDLLRELGAEIIPFSPIHDKELPSVSGLIFGGGYPELYAKALSENRSMRLDILSAAKAGMPILSECGGFLYLQEYITDPEGKEYEMVGLFEGKSHKKDKLGRFGYVTVSADLNNPYLKENEEIRAHEFHYYDTTCNGEVCILKKPSGIYWSGYQSIYNSFGGFAHLYYPSCPEFIKRFLKCRII